MKYSQTDNSAQSANRLIASLRQHMSRFGYEPVDLPIIEDANLFLIKAGDQVINSLFTFERRDQQFALRPEFTAAAAYHYITTENSPPVVRWQFSGAVFVDDPNNFSGNHQQLSIGAELIGLSGTAAEAEIIALSVQGLLAQGIDDWQITIGHTGLIRQMLSRFNLDNRTQRFLLHEYFALKHTADEVLSQFDDRFTALPVVQEAIPYRSNDPFQGELSLTMGGRTHEEIAYRLNQKHKRAAERDQVAAALNALEQWGLAAGTPDTAFPLLERLIARDDIASAATVQEWRDVINLLTAYEITLNRITIQPALARSWEYYTGIVFELRAAGLHIGGGGRYDELTRLIGGRQEVPAVGFAYYGDQLISALPQPNYANTLPVSIIFNHDLSTSAAQWAQALRQHNIAVQILPSGIAPDTDKTLTIENDSTLRFNNKSYTLEQITVLIADLT